MGRSLAFVLGVLVIAGVYPRQAAAQIAPGGPGADATWATAAKQGIGTANSLKSKVWFTLAQGVMTEVYYPDVTTANVHVLQFVVVDPKTKQVETERDDATHQIKVLRPDSLTFQQVNRAKSGKWTITKTYVTDPIGNSVLINIQFIPRAANLELYIYFDPSIANRGMGDQAGFASVTDDGDGFLYAEKPGAHIATALAFSTPIADQTSVFSNDSNGLEQLRLTGKLERRFDIAREGNVVQMARILRPSHFRVALGFGSNRPQAWATSNASRGRGFAKIQAVYERGWSDFVKTLPRVGPKFQAQFNMAAMVLKAQEDKTVRGANVASLTVPWGGGKNANEDVGGGYHMVWARDLYQVFTAYLALGDRAAAGRELDFLFNIQQKSDGSFPQNSVLDGTKGWGGLQMDEVGFPLVMAWQIERFDKATYEKHVKPAAEFIVAKGPFTQEERWEEKGGYSPSTIAAEIAGLVCAADIAKRNGDVGSATRWLATADDWARNVERWTATTNGKYGDGHYYIRISEKGEPDAGQSFSPNNNLGAFQENEIVDAGFLELVRLGIKPADDPLILKSVKVVDDVISVDTPNGAAFYRYNHDGYGELDDGRRWNWDGTYTGKGRPWPLLSGERGEYELAYCGTKSAVVMFKGKPQRTEYADSRCPRNFESRLVSMAAFANEGLMIPEQIWDMPQSPTDRDREFEPELKFGEGTGSATPLAWSMAQFIRLAVNIKAGRGLETPRVVYERYKNGVPTVK